jgi:ribonuclease D
MQYRVISEQAQWDSAVDQLADCRRLWVDTEIADWRCGRGHLSLIQVLAEGPSQEVLFFDVLSLPSGSQRFVEQIMAAPHIEKVFHNSSFDTRYLGGEAAANVTCTLRMARAIPTFQFPVDGYSLKALTEHFGIADTVDKAEQSSDWGVRPLSDEQMAYAALDVVYLREVHLRLIELVKEQEAPETVSISEIDQRLSGLEASYESIKSERDYLRGLLKEAMLEQGCDRSDSYRLSRTQMSPLDVPLSELARRIVASGLEIDTAIRLTREVQKQLGPVGPTLTSVTAPSEQVKLLQSR